MASTFKHGNVVQEYKFGNTRVKICDDAYINKAPEEIEKIKDRVTAIVWECIKTLRAEGKDI